jgi:hypothetical protein
MEEENDQIAHFAWYQEAKKADSGGIKNSPPTGASAPNSDTREAVA